MLDNQLLQLGAPSHDAIPARWMAILDDGNVERRRRSLPLVGFSDRVVGSAPAYVNLGRWVADCPACRGGIAVSPDWPLCCCLDCGRIYEALIPDDAQIAAATELLERRAKHEQNWYPADEPIRLLQAENDLHGLDDTITTDGDVYDQPRFLLPSTLRPVGELRVGSLNLPLGPAT